LNWDDYVNGFGSASGEFWIGIFRILYQKQYIAQNLIASNKNLKASTFSKEL